MVGFDRAKTILKGHTQIFLAIKERNPEKELKKLQEHIQEDLKNLVHILGQKKER
ncbi:DNA-binding GntR family transcriptional regulator [Peribacillus cavernae]|nr:DNA-binding GntR family transcriptional regulator [Peribacillus cavernae]